MTSKERVLSRERERGRQDAKSMQTRSADMTGTELYAEEDKLPNFKAAAANKNMLDRPIGFVCKSTAGRVVKLLQPYDSAIYTQEPEELPAQWGFKWTTDPEKARPFIALSTSPYNAGECCTYEGKTWRSLNNGNVWSPGDYPGWWEEVT